MSELQIALLAIGLGVIAAVYAYGWWQQRRYRRRFGDAFRSSHVDVLYQEVPPDPSKISQSSLLAPMTSALMTGDTPPADKDIGGAAAVSATGLVNEPCSLLDPRSDFIIELHPGEPCLADALGGLWQRKFDFDKPVLVCGLTQSTKKWERAIAEGHTLYTRFRIALQLVDRGGMISAAKLADFRDLVQGVAGNIKAGTTIPDINKVQFLAVELDSFCAEVDQMVGINLIARSGRPLSGSDILQAAIMQGMALESDGAFHLQDAQGHSLFTLITLDSKPFQHHTMETFSTAGVTLLLDVPHAVDPGAQFDRMIHVARELAGELQANMVDDHRVALNDAGLAIIRARIADVEAKMRDQGINPGSAQARRLFS